MTKTDHNSSALHSICQSICARCAQTVLALALVCALAPLASSDPLRFRPGLRNSAGKQRLSAPQLRMVLDSLRHKTGFLEMRFDESGFLTLGDRTRIAGGSATARALIIATVDGGQVFDLECHDHSLDIAFARLATGCNIHHGPTGARIEVRPLQLDFADFAQLLGNREALAAFDPGLAVLHELVHGVLHLHDAVNDTTRLGECDEHVNRMRHELQMPERQHYSPTLRMVKVSGSAGMNVAELLFVRVGGESSRAKAEKFYVRWDVEKVSIINLTSSRGDRGAMVAAAR
jgi:hypothetical protein